jgi:peptidoglycan/xylan/chitin deacetylase (PgdA/CDA1 family)
MNRSASPKDRLAGALFALGMLRRFARARRRCLTIFCYHRIRAHETEDTPFDSGVLGPTASLLEAQLSWLQEHTRVLDLEDYLEIARGSRLPPEPCSLVTFDDGYRDNYELALPVLRKLGLPAVFFIPTQLVSERCVGWWDIIAYLVKKTARTRIEAAGRSIDLSSRPLAAIARLQDLMKTRASSETAGLIDDLSRSTGVALPTPEEQDEQLVSWGQLREATRQGVAIGSHGHSHRVLATLDDREVSEELEISKEILEAQIAAAVRSIAYPCGGRAHYDQRTMRIAASRGYLAGFTLNTGTTGSWPRDQLEVCRHSPGATLARFAGLVALPRQFAWGS